jgi:predicted metal-dependent HD superfamily phosphohydrolase
VGRPGETTTGKPGRYGIEDVFAWSWLRPGYWKTLAHLRPTQPEVALDGATLRFSRYPFEPAVVFPSGTVSAEGIAEVNLGYRCQLRLVGGDILFVPGTSKGALLDLVNRTDVRTTRRSSVWSALLDPFLDTWEEQETIDRQFAWLASLGLDRETVDRWRREVAVAMVAYNFGTSLWEWVDLDLYDLLVAQRARLSRPDFADFYRRAMALAALDPLRPEAAPSPGSDIDGTVFMLLMSWAPATADGTLKDFRQRWGVRMQEIERRKRRLAGELAAAYSQPHRRYHDVTHVVRCLDELAGVGDHAVHLDEVRWALLFHDAVFDPRREDNEARSADWACRVMDELERPTEETARVRSLILATRHAGEPQTPDEALLVDIDLAILGADEAAFDAYDRGIRAEYDWVPEPEYRQARARRLEGFLRRERLYHTAPFRRLEVAARGNLERARRRC